RSTSTATCSRRSTTSPWRACSAWPTGWRRRTTGAHPCREPPEATRDALVPPRGRPGATDHAPPAAAGRRLGPARAGGGGGADGVDPRGDRRGGVHDRSRAGARGGLAPEPRRCRRDHRPAAALVRAPVGEERRGVGTPAARGHGGRDPGGAAARAGPEPWRRGAVVDALARRHERPGVASRAAVAARRRGGGAPAA